MTEPKAVTEKSRRRERRVKIGFAVAAAVMILVVWYWQRNPSRLSWEHDLPGALATARQQNRGVVAFFTHSSYGEMEKRIETFGFIKNYKAVSKSNYILVQVSPSLDSDLARQYKITKLPTLLVLDANGVERNRRELLADVGETDFPQFLDCSVPFNSATTKPRK